MYRRLPARQRLAPLGIGLVICGLTLALDANVAQARPARPGATKVGVWSKLKHQVKLRRALRQAGIGNLKSRRLGGQLTGRRDSALRWGGGKAPGMRGMVKDVRRMALDNKLWRKARYVSSSYDRQRGTASVQLRDARNKEIGRVNLSWAPGNRRSTRLEVTNQLRQSSGRVTAQYDRSQRGELEVSSTLNRRGKPLLQRSERSFAKGLTAAGPLYQMNFGWVTVGPGARTGYRHVKGQRSAEWLAPARTNTSPAPAASSN